jgi:hypothetical protein
MKGIPLQVKAGLAAAMVLSAGLLCGCRDVSAELHASESKETPAPRPGPPALAAIASVPARGIDTEQPFFVTDRRDEWVQFPCTSCHTDSLAAPGNISSEVARRTMHVDIQIQHAEAETMDCRTCHHPENLDQLRLNDGTPITFNEVYRLCAQCHFQQVQDWAGGAHGKRVLAWQGKRIVKQCTDCHNPHAPALKKQWPVLYPQIPRISRTP